jgi:hypothetical protein
MACKFKNMIGELGTGVHSYRLYNIAIVDVIVTFALAYFLNIYIFPNTEYCKVVILLFILGILLHRFFCVQTTVDKFLFDNSAS